MCLNPKDPEAHRIYTEGGGVWPSLYAGQGGRCQAVLVMNCQGGAVPDFTEEVAGTIVAATMSSGNNKIAAVVPMDYDNGNH